VLGAWIHRVSTDVNTAGWTIMIIAILTIAAIALHSDRKSRRH
jgi:hypothetical protein